MLQEGGMKIQDAFTAQEAKSCMLFFGESKDGVVKWY